jgi:hypothetical protein
VWKRVASPDPGGSDHLSGATVFPGGAWAVGGTSTKHFKDFRSLILGWNGTAWK